MNPYLLSEENNNEQTPSERNSGVSADEQELMADEELKEWLEPLQDPEIRMGLVELGLIYEAKHSLVNGQDHAYIKMTLTSPNCPATDFMVQQVRDRVLAHPHIKTAHVELVFEPKWDPKIMATEECKEKMGIW